MDINTLKMLLMEEQYPVLSDEQYNLLATMYDDINLACYMGCMMKSQANKITVGPITIENDTNFWIQLANSFKALYDDTQNNSRGSSNSITGKCIGRADE